MVAEAYRLEVELSSEQAEAALGILYLSGMLGCEESRHGARVLLRGYFPDDRSIQEARERLSGNFPGVAATVSRVVNEDWNRIWRESISPVKVTDDIWIAPSWRAPAASAREYWIRIEPKMTFGTGHHESTRLAARGLQQLGAGVRGARVLDVGTGSGVLCFVAAHYGAAVCIGIEIDLSARENLAENRRENPSPSPVQFTIGTLDCLRPAARFDIVAANMIQTETELLLDRIRSLLVSTGSLVWSGLLHDERDRARASAAAAGFELRDSLQENEWWAGVFRPV